MGNEPRYHDVRFNIDSEARRVMWCCLDQELGKQNNGGSWASFGKGGLVQILARVVQAASVHLGDSSRDSVIDLRSMRTLEPASTALKANKVAAITRLDPTWSCYCLGLTCEVLLVRHGSWKIRNRIVLKSDVSSKQGSFSGTEDPSCTCIEGYSIHVCNISIALPSQESLKSSSQNLGKCIRGSWTPYLLFWEIFLILGNQRVEKWRHSSPPIYFNLAEINIELLRTP